MTEYRPMASDDSAEDPRRLAALAAYDILDTPGESGFDDVVWLAAQVCGTPVALVSFVTDDRQWFKARVGFDACETPLDQSICAHVIEAATFSSFPISPQTRGRSTIRS